MHCRFSRDLETKAILKACISARAALGELKQAAELIPNQAVLINTLPLLDTGYQMLDTGYQMLDTGYQMLDGGIPGTRCWMAG